MSMVNSNHISVINSYENYNCGVQNSPGGYRKPIRLRNVATKAEAFDSLHLKPTEVSTPLI